MAIPGYHGRSRLSFGIERLYKNMEDCGRKLSEKEKALDREAAELEA